MLSLRGMYDAAGEVTRARRRRVSTGAQGSSMAAVVFRHELRYLAGSLGGLAAVAAGIATGAWLLAAREPSVAIAILGCFLGLAAGFFYPSNTFGHDGHALRRYALLGPDWGRVFAAKNRAWLALMGLSVLLPIAASALRVSAAAAVSLFLCAGLVLALAVIWGNVSSVLLPSRAGSGRGNAFVNQLAPFVLCSVPFGVHATVAPFGSSGFDAALCALLAAAAVLYALLLRRISHAFDSDVENVLARF